MMLWRALLLACGLASMPIASAATSEQLAGDWRPQDDPAAVVRIASEAGVYQGRLIEHTEHPDRVGTQVLRDLRWRADQQRWSGKVYAPRLGKLLDADVVADGPDRFTLEVHTWFGSRHVTWDRVRR